jgi:hypothetical protein
MTEPARNTDGTKQVAPPTRSAFSQASKAATPAPSVTPAEQTDKTSSHNPDHVKNLISSLRGLLGRPSDEGPEGGNVQEGGHDVNSAVTEAVNGVPGHATYGGN